MTGAEKYLQLVLLRILAFVVLAGVGLAAAVALSIVAIILFAGVLEWILARLIGM